MNAVLLTLLALPGADAAVVHAGAVGPEAVYGAEMPPYGVGPSGYGVAAGAYGEACEACEGSRHGHQGHGLRGWCGPMPQSCYNPSVGCYPSTRFMHRYPAFHNVYYRKAYNYRNYFDYPWHAGLHEPTSMFSYHVPGEAAAQALPVPTPSAGMPASGNGARSAATAGVSRMR
jgi:hypothetical protein